MDLSEGLRKNFNPRKEWKNAIFKVRVTNALQNKGKAVKGGRTTSDEEEDGTEDEAAAYPRHSLMPSPPNRQDSKGVSSQQPAPASPVQEGDALTIHNKEKEEFEKEAAQKQANGKPTGGAGPSARPPAQPTGYRSHHDPDDDDTDDGGQSWGQKSMPGSFNFGSPKRNATPVADGHGDGANGEGFLTQMANLARGKKS